MLATRALAVPTDVRDEAAVQRLAGEAEKRFGGIDIWVNNAGVTLLGRFEDAPAGLWREVVDANFYGCVNGARGAAGAAPPRWRRADQRRVGELASRSPVRECVRVLQVRGPRLRRTPARRAPR